MAAYRVRGLLRDIHLWIGLCLMVVFIPLGLSGSWMVFEDDFDKMLHPHRYQASSGDAELSPSRYLTAAQQAFVNRAPIVQLRMPEDQGAPVVVSSTTGLTAWVDPTSGKVLDVGNPRTELRAVAHQFHENLFMARTGRRIVGWIGVALFLTSVTGLITWWPRNNAVLRGLRWQRSPLVWSNIHHLVGFWSSVFLAILSLTGVALAFPELLRPTGGAPGRGERFEGGPPARFSFAPPVASPHLSADQAVSSAEKATGASDFESLRLPTQGDPPRWQVVVLGQTGPTFVSVDDQTGQASTLAGRGGRGGFRGGERRGEGGGGRPPAMRVIRLLHAGNDAPMIWRVVLFIVGLVPTIMGLTGLVIWLRTRRRPELQTPEVG